MGNAENYIIPALREEGASAIYGLSVLQINLELNTGDYSEKPRNPLSGAIENLHFINGKISEVVGSFFSLDGRSLKFNYFPRTLEGCRPFIYHAEELPNRLVYQTAPDRRPFPLSEGRLNSIWSANQNRQAIEALGTLSKKELIERFKKHISSSIK